MSFRPAALQFFRSLAKNNRKEWFEAHRDDFEREVLGPMREFVEEIDARLARFAPEIVGDPKRSVFRIYRDTRFSKDKSPYKTHAAAWFYHRDADPRQGRDAGGAGFYFHLQPGYCWLGGGMWMPVAEPLGKIRDALVEDHRSFERIVTSRAFRRRFGELSAEKVMKRPPRGVDPTTPAARWLRYQSFTAGRMVTRAEATRVDLPAIAAKDFKAITPLVRWINRALGLRTATKR